MLNILKLLFTRPSKAKFKRFFRRIRKLNLRKLLKNKQFRLNIGITAFVIFLLIAFSAVLPDKYKVGYHETVTRYDAIEALILPVKEKPAPEAELPAKEHIKVAIILDDAGGTTSDYSLMYEIRMPLTVAVIPFLPWSEKVAIDSIFNGYEVMLHLPMEPINEKYSRNDGSMVTVDMSDEEIESFVRSSIDNVKWAVGVNNHMGSRATQDNRVMEAVMRVIKRRPFYFVDSKTSKNSVAHATARRMGVLSASNNVFLDTDNEKDSIKAKLSELVQLARIRGSAIGIGHVTRRETLEVLKENMPLYKERGVEFVHASELVR